MPAQLQEFRFTIKYTGERAARLVSGTILHWELCSMFKDDLTALRVNHPKVDQIQKGPPGSIYFLYSLSKKTCVRSVRCMEYLGIWRCLWRLHGL